MLSDQGTIMMPPQMSTVAAGVDQTYYLIYYTSLFFFALIVGLSTYFVIKYRRKSEVLEKTPDISHNALLETVWTVIPSIILLIFFVIGFRGFLKMTIVPKDPIEVKVTAQRWSWGFDYNNGATSTNELVVPVDKPIKLLMSSRDVIHSFFVPAFRIKNDVLPNRYSHVWFEATKTGDYNLMCTEYCGTQHSGMIGKVKVVSWEEYNNWLDESAAEMGADVPLEAIGEKLYTKQACFTCHSLDGSPKVGGGPSFLGRFGTEVLFTDGTKAQMDENYIRTSILNPQSQIAAGYAPVMPIYQGLLKDRELDALVAFIKTLNKKE